MPVESGEMEGSPEAERRFAHAASLADLLEIILVEVGERTGFDRLVAAAGLDGHGQGASVGVPPEDVDAFVSALMRRETQQIPPLDSASPPPGIEPLSALDSFRSGVLLPAVTPADGFVAAMAIESEPGHPELATVNTILRAAAPFLYRTAEVHALRVRVADLESRQLRSRRALDALPDPVLVMDEESRILLANDRADQLLVTTPDDSSGRRHAVETNNLFFSAFRARAILERERGQVTRELLLVDPTDGSDLLSEVFVLPFRDSEGRSGSSIFVLRDITDLKQATHELEVQYRRSVAAEHRARRESERLNVIIENAGVPIFVTDIHTNVMLMNREADRLLGIGPKGSETLPRVQDIRANDARLAGFLNELLLQPGLRREAQLTLVDPDEGREFPVLAVSTKILDDRDEPLAMVTVLRDLTQEVENRHLAQELRRLNVELEERVAAATHKLAQRNAQLEEQRAELERASRLKSEFLATMSHELRTPINAVLGYNSLLAEGLFGPLAEDQRDALQRMRNAAEHLLSLINDILDLSLVEAGKLHVKAGDIDVALFLERLSETVRPMAAQKGLGYRIDVDPDVESVRTDETRLRQVLLNLLSNAVKFTDSGSVTVRARRHRSGEGIVLDVIDTGVGIGEDNLETIFEEFTQADQSATREHGGTGLGLAISRKLIGLMGGSLQVSSEVGRGATFSVRLPLLPPATWGDTGRSEAASSEGVPPR